MVRRVTGVSFFLQLCSLTHDPSRILFIREDGFDESADKVETFITLL